MTPIDQLNEILRKAVPELGLVFVAGPGPDAVAAPAGSVGEANGQRRVTYLFAVAEAT